MDNVRSGTAVRLAVTYDKKSNSGGRRKPSLDYYDTKQYSTKDTSTLSRSKKAQLEISAVKRTVLGSLPLFVQLGHKGLEKGQPAPIETFGSTHTYQISNDILAVSVRNPLLYDDIKSIEFTYSTVK